MNLVADYSYLQDLCDCPRKFQLRHERGFQPLEGKAWPLIAGSAVHAGLRVLYTEGFEAADQAVEAAVEAFGPRRPAPDGKWGYLSAGHIEVVMRNYVDDRKDDEWKVLKLPGLTAVETAVIGTVGDSGAEYGGLPDLAVEVDGEVYIPDHKSTGEWLTDYWAQQFVITNQLRGYALLIQQKTGLHIAGGIINGVYTGPNAADPRSAWKTRKSQRSAWFGPYNFDPGHLRETERWVEQRLAEIEWRRSHDFWPQNTRACRGCEFLEVCKKPPIAREAALKQKFRVREKTGVLASGADSEE